MEWKKQFYKEYIDQLVSNTDQLIIIFGCGQRGKLLYELLKKNDYTISAFCDNKEEMWGKETLGTKVLEPAACVKSFPTAIYMIAIKDMYDVISTQLGSSGISEENIRYFNCSEVELSKKARTWYFPMVLDENYVIDENYSRESNYFGVKRCHETTERYFRILNDNYLENEVISPGKKIDFIKDFEAVYGPYRKLEDAVKKDCEEKTTKILVACCHKDKSILADADKTYFVPIQVGAKLAAEKIYDITDDIGENISDRNNNYCECTALYWAWKNNWEASCDYIGLRHYRRKLDISEKQLQGLSENQIDLVLMEPTYLSNIHKHFAGCTKNENDWDVMREAIDTLYPEYSDSFAILEKQHFLCQCNMFVMKRGLFDSYCEFLFSVLGYVEDHYNQQMERNDRYLGYLGEILMSLYAIHNHRNLKIAYADMKFLE